MPRLTTLALTLLLAAPAAADAAELWRVIGIFRPSWSTVPLSPDTKALRGAGLVVDDGWVKAPPPIACAAAQTRGEMAPWREILGDQTTDAHIDELLAVMHSQGRQPYLRRITCADHETDFLSVDLHGLIPFDGAFLVLEQPMDADHVADLDDWTRPLHPGFDCTHASETSERLACTNYQLSVAYRNMSQTYARLHDTVSAASFATIRDAQRGWVAYVDARCHANVPFPDEWTDRRDIADPGGAYWFQRTWDATNETWFTPIPVGSPTHAEIDEARSVRHGLGFVPLVWIRNLPGGDDIDGACTFRPAVETAIEIDYQLSQAGRGLKYSSDPLLLIREPAGRDGGDFIRSGGNALVVSERGDARLLEIGGTAAAAVIEYVRTLREMALEGVHGNRSSADRIAAAQSGRAIELMNQGLIWFADNQRVSCCAGGRHGRAHDGQSVLGHPQTTRALGNARNMG